MNLSRVVDIEIDSHSGYPEDSYVARAYIPLWNFLPQSLVDLFPKLLYRECTSQELEQLTEDGYL
jgi:hypothetical protein